jgi:Acyl-CoA reductase (LuxC)
MNGRVRVEALVASARRIADGASEFGRRARRLLAASTGLSLENVEWSLVHALETAPSETELTALSLSVEPARGAYVVLPANVFVAAHRAIALALAASPLVRVRPSRREPHFARLLAEGAPGLFELVDDFAPAGGDHVFAYGSDTTLAAIRARLPPGAALHAHGPGFGIAVVDVRHATAEAAHALAADVAAFDQRGCLSPRAAFVLADRAETERFAELLARALAERARSVPLGRLDDAEQADVARFRDALIYAGSLLAAGPGWVSVTDGAALLAPVGRNLCVVPAASITQALSVFDASRLTAVGVAGPSELATELRRALPGARVSELGRMQRPAFDGPADRRAAHGA